MNDLRKDKALINACRAYLMVEYDLSEDEPIAQCLEAALQHVEDAATDIGDDLSNHFYSGMNLYIGDLQNIRESGERFFELMQYPTKGETDNG